jgi:fibronectin-binding autotransporter adhesin
MKTISLNARFPNLVFMMCLISGFLKADTPVKNNFEDGTSQSWTLTTTATLYSYVSGVNYAYEGTKAIKIPVNGTGGIATLTSSLTGYTSYKFYFSWKWEGSASTRFFSVDYSLNGGSSWSTGDWIKIVSSTQPSGSMSQTLTALAGDNVKFRFRGKTDAGGAYNAFIDTVLITTAPITVSYWDLNGVESGAGGETPSGTWDSVTTNWNGVADGSGSVAVWTAGQQAIFAAGSDAIGSYTVTVDGLQEIADLSFEDGIVTLASGISSGFRLIGDSSVTVGSGLTATISPPIDTIYGAALSLSKSGGGTLVLSGSNTYSGTTTVSAGSLKAGVVSIANVSGAFGKDSPITMANVSGVTLDLNGYNTQIGLLTGGGTTGGNVTLNGGNLTINTTSSSGTAYAGVISGSGNLIKTGTGVQVLSGNNTYSGSTTVNTGILDFASGTLGFGSGRDITVSAGMAIKRTALDNAFLNRLVETTDEITVMTGTASTSFDLSSSTGANLPNAFLGNWANNGAKCEYSGLIMPASDAYRLGGKLSSGLLGIVGANKLTGTQGLIVGGTGGSGIRVELAAAQDFTGDTVISTGAKLTLGNNLALQNSTLSLGASGGSFALHAAFVTGHITGATESPSPTFGGLSGSRSLYSSFSSIAGNNEALLANTAVTNFTLNLAVNKTNTYSGAIGGFGAGASGGNGGAMTLTKSGDGVQILSGSCTYTGATTTAAGTLGLGANNILTNSPIVLTGGTLDAGTYSNALKTLTLSGTATINLGTGGKLVFGNSSGLTWSGTLNVTGDFVKSQSLRFGTTSSGLTTEQLAKIKVVGGGYAVLDDNGYIKSYQGTLILLQ